MISTHSKVSPHWLILPALWLNSLLGNQVWSATYVSAGQFFYWVSLLLAVLLVCKTFNRSYWPYLLALIVVASRAGALAELPAFRDIYIASMLVLFASTGIALALRWPSMIEKQARAFIAWCLPLMILQVAGVSESLQQFNTLYLVDVLAEPGEVVPRPEIRLLPLLFSPTAELIATRYGDFYEFLSMQARPPGLSHSNAMLALFVLAGAAVHLGRMRAQRTKVYDLVLVAVVVLSGAKAVILGFTLLLLLAVVRCERALLPRHARLFLFLAAMIGLYALLFPAAAMQNIGRDAFATSFLTRAVDAIAAIAPNLVYLPEVAEVITTYSSVFGDERDGIGRLSGVVSLLRILPFALLGALLAVPWLKRGFVYCRAAEPRLARTSEYMLLVVLIAPLATPILGSQLYACCVGVALMPLALGSSKRLRDRIEAPRLVQA